MLDAEFTVTEGPYIRRKFWQTLDHLGRQARRDRRLDRREDHQEHAPGSVRQRARPRSGGHQRGDQGQAHLRGFADLSGITFVAKIKVEASNNPD